MTSAQAMTPTSSPGRLPSVDPRTGNTLGLFPDMDAATVRDRVDRARRFQPAWGAESPADRGRHLLRIRASLVRHARTIARTASNETGKPVQDAYYELFAACAMLTWAAKHAEPALRARTMPSYPVATKRARLVYEPHGVVGLISPWNYPIGIPFQVLPYALAAGNTVALKPSELATLTGMKLAEAINDAGFELVEVISGGGVAGEALVRSPVDMIAFTGSPGTARHILRAAAESLTPVVLELGGKDPMVVAEDADVERAALTATAAAFINAGQTCMATERALVVDAVHDQFVAHVLDATRRVRQGPSGNVQVGPLTRPQHMAVLQSRLDEAVAKGARVVAGGRPRDDLGTGTWLEPTVVTGVTPAMALFREESFGPILSIVRVRDVDEAVAFANDSDYGLSASVFTEDADRGRDIASRLRTGGVNVNDAMLGAAMAGLPFGGVRQSGFGRLQGEQGFRTFSTSKGVTEDRVPGAPALMATMFHGRHRPPVRVLQAALQLLFGRSG